MVTKEGAWDCTQCNTKGIPGRQLNCSHCGDPRNPLLDPEERPYLPANASVVTDDEGLRLAELGPNWNCGQCGESNLSTSIRCMKCDEPLNYDDDVAGVHTYVSGVDAQGVATVSDEQLDEDRIDLVLEGTDNLRELEPDPLIAPSRTLAAADIPRRGIVDPPPRAQPYRLSVALGGKTLPKSTPIVSAIVAAIIVILGGGTLTYNTFFKTSTVELTVNNMTWERQIEIEEFRTLNREGWDHPTDARIQSKRPKVHHYESVKTGTITVEYTESHEVKTGTTTVEVACGSRTVDNGNGFFTEETTYCDQEVPVYQTVHETKEREEDVYEDIPVKKTWYVYEIDRWETDRFDTSSGDSDKAGVMPAWPATTESGSDERVGNEKRETYEVDLTDAEGRSFSESLDYDQWSLLSEGETVTGEQTRRGSLRSVNWPDE